MAAASTTSSTDDAQARRAEVLARLGVKTLMARPRRLRLP